MRGEEVLVVSVLERTVRQRNANLTPRRSGDVTQQAECRIVYPVVAGSNPAVLAFLYIAAALRPVLYSYITHRGRGWRLFYIPGSGETRRRGVLCQPRRFC